MNKTVSSGHILGFILFIVRAITALPDRRFSGSSIGISLEKELADCMADEFNKSMFSPEAKLRNH